MKRLGILGSMVWDTIYRRDPAQARAEEWGGIAYALAALDAALDPGWQVVPLIKVGHDLAARANQFLGSLRRTARDARFVEVPEPNNRVTLRYLDTERRCERLSGGVPPWTWPELGPMIQDLDALYVNFISGAELSLETARLLRRGFPRFVYADFHSLFLGTEPDGTRVPRALPAAPDWFECFDIVQMNEEELSLLGDDPPVVAAMALGRGCTALCVTLGPAGALYFTGRPTRAVRIPPHPGLEGSGDPTGCGDVFGAVAAAGLVSGKTLDEAFRHATVLAARNVELRGATGLRDHLLGRLARS